jgi:hypothetical protein
MEIVSIAAHFDGDRILLDEAIELKPNTKLLVTVLPQQDDDRDFWLALSAQGLANAYGPDEPEYSLDMIKEFNPEYEGR